MQTGTLVTIAWICFFGTSALVWGLTSAFFSHVLGLQDQVVRGRLTTILLRANLGITDADQFRVLINQGNLQILPTPDIVEGCKIFRYRMLVGLIFSAIFAVLPICFEVVLGGQQQELQIAEEFYRYFCGGSILLDFLLIINCLSAPARWGVIGMIGEVLHWRALVSLFERSE